MVSHDLKAPLRSIDTLINWFKEDNQSILDEEKNKSLDLILSNVEKMDLLIKGVLEYSSIENQEVNDRDIDLNFLIDEVLRTINIPNHFNITLKNKMPIVFGNVFRYKQLFQNLIQNAIKYNDKPNGLIEIESSVENNEIKFSIKDNGIGIKEVYQTKIFKMFAKLENKDE
jgi:light-regulated signal transduction histidine kinase (bacteriophytochrome)